MKPTLKQIFDFGLELENKEKVHITKGREYSQFRPSKKYLKYVIVYASVFWFDYTAQEVADYCKMNKSIIHSYICIVNKSDKKQASAEELYNSLIYIFEKSFITFRADILKSFKREGNHINSTQTKLEKWLINRLYKIENK